jgi:pimeloyl-ACP methyl ester carboxylesterase
VLEREDVTYWSGGHRVRGWLYSASRAGRGPAPAVVLCPGFTGTRYGAFYRPYVEALVAQGMVALVSDYRGWGDSDGPRGEIVPGRQIEDVRSALSYLETRPEVDPDRLWLLGFSFGGGIAISAAGADERVRCCVAVSPVADGRRWLRDMRREYEWRELLDALAADRRRRALGEPARVVQTTDGIMIAAPERSATTVKGDVPEGKVPRETPLWCAETIIDFAPYRLARRCARRGLLLFAVENDVVIPPRHARRIRSHAGDGCELTMLRGGGHYDAYVRHYATIRDASLRFVAGRCSDDSTTRR